MSDLFRNHIVGFTTRWLICNSNLKFIPVHIFYLQDDYNAVHGGKWTVQNLRLYLESSRGKEVRGDCCGYVYNSNVIDI